MQKILSIILLSFFFTNCKSVNIDTSNEETNSHITFIRLPERVGFVNDYENLLLESERKNISGLLNYYFKSCQNEISIVSIDSLPKGVQFDEYAKLISNDWEIGKTNGNGLTILISKSMNQIEIATSLSTDFTIPNEFRKKLISEILIPKINTDGYYKGILVAIQEIVNHWK